MDTRPFDIEDAPMIEELMAEEAPTTLTTGVEQPIPTGWRGVDWEEEFRAS